MTRIRQIGGHVWRWAAFTGVSYLGIRATEIVWQAGEPLVAVGAVPAFLLVASAFLRDALRGHSRRKDAAA